MPILLLDCAETPLTQVPAGVDVHRLSAIPSRQEMKFLDAAAKAVLPHDPTPSLDEISQQPDVEHMGEPAAPPQEPEEELRVVVRGTDASLSAVLTRMMRGDYLWANVGYIPVGDSLAAQNWGLDGDLEFALEAPPQPVPVIRNDRSIVVAGHATITASDAGAFEGEIIVDDDVLVRQQTRPEHARFFSQFGARLVPTTTAPGIAAVRLTTPPSALFDEPAPRGPRAWLGSRVLKSIGPQQAQAYYETPSLRWMVAHAPVPTDGLDPRTLMTGRALQAGGNKMKVTIDGVSGRHAVDRVTFYRHLRDGQIIRP